MEANFLSRITHSETTCIKGSGLIFKNRRVITGIYKIASTYRSCIYIYIYHCKNGLVVVTQSGYPGCMAYSRMQKKVCDIFVKLRESLMKVTL